MSEYPDLAFLEYVVGAIVEFPDDVKITRTVDEMGVLLTMTVNQADMGKVIGKGGNTAQALRTLLRSIGLKTNARINLKINEPEGGAAPATAPAPEAPVAADPDAAMDALRDEE